MHDIWAFSDIHGQGKLFDKILKFCFAQDPESHIIYLGDACDRGPDGYRIMKTLLNHPQVGYLKGNHEDMFCKAAREIKQKLNFESFDKEYIKNVLKTCDYKCVAIQDSLYNEGLRTLTDWIVDGMPLDIVEQLENLPLTFSYGNLDFCHAAGIYKTFQEAADAEYYGRKPYKYTELSLLWSRSAIDTAWQDNRIVIYGHTPTIYFSDCTNWKKPENWMPAPILYNNKLNMDTGAIFTHRAFVLNILTMKAYGFEEKDDLIEEIEVIQF